MTFFLLYLGTMSVPGALLARAMGLRDGVAGFAVSLSLAISVLVLLLARVLGLGPQGYGGMLLGTVCVLLVLVLWRWRTSGAIPRRPHFEAVHLLGVGTLLAVAAYQLWAGPYLEVPGDPWYHLGRINNWLDNLDGGDIGAVESLRSLSAGQAEYWYVVAGYLLLVSGMEIDPGVAYLSLANSLLFSAAIFSFALFFFTPLVPNRVVRYTAAAISVLFFFIHFGLGPFSYVRYYVFAPAFLNFIAHLAALVCVAVFLRDGRPKPGVVIAFAILLGTTVLVHLQEALFVIVVAGVMLVVGYVASRYPRHVLGGPADQSTMVHGSSRTFAILVLLLLALYAGLHAYAFLVLDRHNPLVYGRLVDVRQYLPFLKDLYVLKPDYQFYQVVTAWGLLVYVLFFVKIRALMVSPYLVAGMLLPIVTVFNPLFTDFFLRFSNPLVLWRFCYAIPLSFVGAYFLVQAIQSAFHGCVIRRVGGVTVTIFLVALLFPVDFGKLELRHSKFPMLAPVDPGNDHRHWADLIAYLDARESGGVITDRVTGYVLNGMTGHHYRGYKFYGQYASHVLEKRYDEEDFGPPLGWKRLVRYRDFQADRPWLVIVNLRDGRPSRIGELGGHWPRHIMEVSRLYSEAFLEYIDRYPDMFRLMWEKNDIRVYEVGS